MAGRLLRNMPFRRYPSNDGSVAIPPAVHIIRGDSAGGALKATGASPVICVPDNLAVGPSSASPSEHRQLRLRYWRQEWTDTVRYEHDRDYLPPDDALVAGPGLARSVFAGERGRVLLWGSGSWSDLLFLGWAVDALDRARVARDRIGIAGPLSAAFPLGYLNPEQLAPFGARARTVGARRADAAVRLWSSFTSSTPAELEKVRRDPESPFPTLRREAGLYAAFLPRPKTRDRRRLQVSEVDEALLTALSEREWRSLPDLLRTPPSRARWPTSAVFAMLKCFGEFFIETRLRRWSRSPSAAVECEEQKGRYRLAFRLRARGKYILDEGVDDLTTLPRTQIGGYELARGSPWICAPTGTSWMMRPRSR